MSPREKVMRATAELLVEAGGNDVSTRAICERAGVAPPALYRNFGDKDGLVAAVVADAFDAYLDHKRRAEPLEDPVADLRAGWDSHTRWAVENPAYYRLIFGSGPDSTAPAAEAIRLLRAVLDRCAGAGLLVVPPDVAAQVVMAANVGVSLMLIRFPTLYTAADLSDRLRDTIHAAVLAEGAGPEGAAGATPPLEVPRTATTLRAQLATTPSPVLSDREAGLLDEWLQRLSAGAGR